MKKLLLNVYKKLNKNMSMPYSNDERYLIRIALRLFKDETTELIIEPTMTEFYIRTKDHQYTIILNFSTDIAEVYNHKFGYNIKMSPRLSSYLYNAYKKECAKRRKEMVDEVRSNIEFSLYSVVKNIEKQQKAKSIMETPIAIEREELESQIV